MDFLEKLKNRYNIITFVLVILVLALSLRLAVLTIAQGDYYRDLSDNKRLKEVYTSAPRGEIRDREGRLLAGNKPSFTIRLFKDEINLYSTMEKNEAFLKLVRLMEEDGVNYVDEFPIQLNVFKYKSEKDYEKEELTPTDKIIEIIQENQLMEEVLKTHYSYQGYQEHYTFITANRAINALKYKGLDMPIDVELEGDKVAISFDENKDIEAWKEENKLEEKDTAIESLIKLIGVDKTIIRKIIDHSISRELIYKTLKDRGLTDNIILEEYANSYMEEYLEQKRNLSQTFSEITMETKPIDDFIAIFKKISLKDFLQTTYKVGEDKKLLIPAEVLKEVLEKKGIDPAINIEYFEEEDRLAIRHRDRKELDQVETIEELIDLSEEARALKDFISREEIRSLAQSKLLEDGINPRISISDEFEYVAINNLNNFYERFKIKKGTSVDQAFEALKKTYSIDKNLSKYEARGIFVLYNQVQKQGYLAYQPIYLAYGLKESTVAKLEEGLMGFNGIDISIEAVRYYPEGETAAHMLGYLGKISQASEIEKYVGEKKYSPSDIIGKTGVEESFEDYLSGTYGIRRIEVDSTGNTTSVLEEEKAIPGNNLYLSLDLNVQKVAEKALEQNIKELQQAGTYKSPWGDFKFPTNTSERRPYNKATSGAVVAIDVKTGQIIASASYPSYDPNLFTTGISNSDWLSLLPEDEEDPLAPRPLYNIATQTAIQPGSIYKMATALTALEKGVSPTKKVRDMGYVNVGNSTKNCLLWTTNRRSHGYVDVYDAIKDSCNYYFYSLAYGSNPRTGEYIGPKIDIEDLAEMGSKLGLNDKTGIEINIPAERSVGVPTAEKEIETQKGVLRRYLNANIEKYFEEDLDYDEKYKEEVVEEIVGWVDEETPSRGEIIRRMEEMKIRPEVRLEDKDGKIEREGIADRVLYSYLRYAGWNISDMLGVTIGEGSNAYTPLQMANYMTTIANGGYRHKLSLVDNIKNYNNSETIFSHSPSPERIEMVDYKNLDHIKEGMRRVSNDGTSRAIFGKFPVQVGSKSGTATNDSIHPVTGEGYDPFSWFVGFAPYDDPQIAVVSVIFQGGSGGNSAPMVRDIMAEYLGLNKEETQDNLPFENILNHD